MIIWFHLMMNILREVLTMRNKGLAAIILASVLLSTACSTGTATKNTSNSSSDGYWSTNARRGYYKAGYRRR